MKTTSKSILLLSYIFLFTFTACKKENNPPAPEPPKGVNDLHLTLGNPSNAQKDISSSGNYLLQKPQYTLSYNSSIGTANWVSWKLTQSNLGSTSRQDDFRADEALPSSWYRVSETDFFNSGFDRGHFCPSGDRTNSVADNSATFLMTNMIPQAPNNNQITWENLERYCRTLVGQGKELYIIAGPHSTGGSGSKGGITYTLAQGKVVVPQSLWKIVVVLSPGASNTEHVSSTTRVIAVNIPNTQTSSNQHWSYYRTSVDQLETMTGYNFLSNVPASIQDALEAAVDAGPTN